MFTSRSVKIQMQTWKHETEIQTLILTHRRLYWKSAQKVSETMEKLSHLHKYQQPCALAISEAWLDDRAPDGRVVSGCSWAFHWTLCYGRAQQQWGLLSHQGSVVQIRNGNIWCSTVTRMLSVLLRHSHLPQESLFIPPFKLQANHLFFISNPIFRTGCPDCYLQAIR